MADISVDISIATGTARAPRSLVYTTDLIGYWFFLDGDGIFGYRKTTDGGATWAAQVDVDGAVAVTTCAFDVWFDQWTPGDTGTLIHCWWFDTTNDVVRWRTLNTNGDTLGTVRTVFTGASAVAGRGCFVSGTKTTSGYLYAAFDLDAGAERGLHRSTDSGTTWSSNLATTFVEATLDTCSLFPASGTGDGNDCWALYYDASATALTLKLWDSSAVAQVESATIQTHTDGATDLTGQLGYAGAIRHSDGHLIVAAVSLRDNASSTHQVFDCTSTASIATKTAITANIDDHYFPQVFISPDDTIHVAYNGKRDGTETLDTTTKVYYTKSTDGGTTWSAGDTAYMEGAAGVVLQVWTPLNGNRFAAAWRVGAAVSTNKVNSLVFPEGTLAATLDAATVSGTGECSILRTGTLAVTLDALTASATAGAGVEATIGAPPVTSRLFARHTSVVWDGTLGQATSFVGTGRPLAVMRFLLNRATTGAGTVEARLYAADGSTGAATGAPLAVSAARDNSDLPLNERTWVAFDLPPVTLTAAVPYVAAVWTTGAAEADRLQVIGTDEDSEVAPGVFFSATWTDTAPDPWTDAVFDGEESLLFEVFTGTALDAATSSATGTADVVGSTSATLDAATVAGTGTVEANGPSGTLVVTLDALTVTATGEHPPASATLTVTLDALTDTGTGTADVVGSTSATLGTLTLAGTGEHPPASGTLAVTLDALTDTGTGTADVVGSTSATLGTLTVTGVGALTNGPAGELAVTLDALAETATGTAEVAGTATPTLGTLTVSATGTQGPLSANLTATLEVCTLSASGTVVDPPPVLGTLTVTLDGLSAIGTGALAAVATLDATLAALTVSGSGYAAFENPDPRTGFTITVGDSDRTVDIGAHDRVAILTGSRTMTLTGHRGRTMILEE